MAEVAGRPTRPGRRGRGADEAARTAEVVERDYTVEVDGRLHSVKVIGARGARPRSRRRAGARAPAEARARGGARRRRRRARRSPRRSRARSSRSRSSEGAEVEEGALICVIEAMKMENEITAHRAGKVTELNVSEGASVNAGDADRKIE